ncbi:MAG: GIY-YIG nuclease family protein [Candidatus Omnitrophica bacterium]|nr:GIY-YIG nuclease family protein [Candidatus Omnitrophota bacterium]
MASRTRLAIGRLGGFELKSGYYCYVGSGFGPGGVRSRLAHHFRPIRRPHWHVDYLRKAALIERAWYAVHEKKQEHRWAEILRRMANASNPIPGFGSTDCSWSIAGRKFYAGWPMPRIPFPASAPLTAVVPAICFTFVLDRLPIS